MNEEPEHTPEHTQEKKLHLIEDRIDQVLLKARRIFFCDAVDWDTAKEAIRRLWYLDLQEPGKPILLVINSPGGATDAGFAIWDQVHMLQSPISTLVSGLAASMGSVLSLCAPRGRRFATPHARFMIHQPSLSGVLRGQATDLVIQAKEMQKTRSMIVDIYAKATGKSAQEIERAIDRDHWMSASEALEFGHIDRIISSYKELE